MEANSRLASAWVSKRDRIVPYVLIPVRCLTSKPEHVHVQPDAVLRYVQPLSETDVVQYFLPAANIAAAEERIGLGRRVQLF